MVDQTMNNENEAALQWLDDAHRFARREGQWKLAGLVEIVRAEVVFEVELDSLPEGTEEVSVLMPPVMENSYEKTT